MRAALGDRIPMMELLVEYGGGVDVEWNANFPTLFGACEMVDAAALRWRLERGADTNCSKPGQRRAVPPAGCARYSRWRIGGSRNSISALRQSGSGRAASRSRCAGRRTSGGGRLRRRRPDADFPLCHAVSRLGPTVTKLLFDRGADLPVRFPGVAGQTVTLLREPGGPE